MSQSYVFRPENAQLVLGSNDANLPYLEMLMATDLSVRGTAVSASGDVPLFIPFMKRLEKAAEDLEEYADVLSVSQVEED